MTKLSSKSQFINSMSDKERSAFDAGFMRHIAELNDDERRRSKLNANQAMARTKKRFLKTLDHLSKS